MPECRKQLRMPCYDADLSRCGLCGAFEQPVQRRNGTCNKKFRDVVQREARGHARWNLEPMNKRIVREQWREDVSVLCAVCQIDIDLPFKAPHSFTCRVLLKQLFSMIDCPLYSIRGKEKLVSHWNLWGLKWNEQKWTAVFSCQALHLNVPHQLFCFYSHVVRVENSMSFLELIVTEWRKNMFCLNENEYWADHGIQIKCNQKTS